MKRETLWKALGTGMLAASLIVSPLAGVSAMAAEPGTTEGTETSTEKEGGSALALDPTFEGKDAVGTEGEEGYVPAIPAYSDTEIDVWGFTEDATVYSVDVEWGAMTFQWESSTWDPEHHVKKTDNPHWKVYDSTENKALDATEDLINEVKVTNHSNAPVWATLDYATEADYNTTGAFSYTDGIAADAADKDVLAAKLTQAAGGVSTYLSLETADNGTDGAAGTPTVAKAYFMPDGLADAKKTSGFEKWQKIGTITVGIKTEQPTAATTTPDVTEP